MLAGLAVTLMASSGCLSTVGRRNGCGTTTHPTLQRRVCRADSRSSRRTTRLAYKVPSFTVDWVTKQSVFPREALEDASRGWTRWWPGTGTRRPRVPESVWAPTVRFVAGRYLMMFTASVGQHERAACIGLATASSVVGPYKSTMDAFCDPNPKVPRGSILSCPGRGRTRGSSGAASGHQLPPPRAGPAGGSDILIQKLSSNGLTLVGSPGRSSPSPRRTSSPLSLQLNDRRVRREPLAGQGSVQRLRPPGVVRRLPFGELPARWRCRASSRTKCLPSEGANISPLLEVSERDR